METDATKAFSMIMKTLENVSGMKGEVHGNKWHSMRLLHSEDGMGVTITDSILEECFEMTLGQKNHLEACYSLEGEGTADELDNCTVHKIQAGTLYATNNHDRHRIHAKMRMRVICNFVPLLTRTETHNSDGSL